MGCEDDCNICGDVDDAVLRLDAHPTQLDVLRVSRAHLGVVLHHKQDNISSQAAKVCDTCDVKRENLLELQHHVRDL